jgi:YbbR domain-containing protein
LKKIIHNWHIKLISIGLAFILWIYVENIKEIEHSYPVPVEIRNIPDEYLVSNDLPIHINVILKGNERNLQQIEDSNIKAYVDIKNSTESDRRGIVKIDKNSIPSRVSIKEITPRVVEIKIEKIRIKIVKVIPVIVEEPPEGYLFQDVVIEPEQVKIKGPESQVAEIDSIYTMDINIGDLTETIVKEVGVHIGDKLLLVDEEAVSAKIIIKEKFIIKDIRKSEITSINVREDFSVLIEEVIPSVFFKIPKRLENSISRNKFSLYVDCGDIEEPGIYSLPLLVKLNINSVSLIKIEPPSAEVTVEKKQDADVSAEDTAD